MKTMSGKKELERDAYKAVMRAFLATEDSFSVVSIFDFFATWNVS